MKEFFEHRSTSGMIRLKLSETRKWEKSKYELCQEIIGIVEQYQADGYTLSLRQLYYQLVAADYIPNHDTVYKRLSAVLDDLRYSAQVDWDAIEDRGRVPYLPYHADSISDALKTITNVFRLDRQKGQPTCIEVWTEKDAISGVLRTITSEFHVQLVVNKGYSSSTAMHTAYQRIAGELNSGRSFKILYFGDHDPSGLDMVRDIRERLEFFLLHGTEIDTDEFEERCRLDGYDDRDLFEDLYVDEDKYQVAQEMGDDDEERALIRRAWVRKFIDGRFSVEHIGLTRAQIDKYNPPPNPAKITDPRADGTCASMAGPVGRLMPCRHR